MKRLFFQAIIVFSAIVLAGCREDSGEDNKTPSMPPPFSHYFIGGYLTPSEVKVALNDNGVLRLYADGEFIMTPREYNDAISEEALHLAQRYNDTSYNAAGGGVYAFAYPIDEITISSEQDFDARHPAGTVLDDIVEMQYTSYYPFILNGYNLIYNPSLDTKWWSVPYDLCLDCVCGDLATLISCTPEGKTLGTLTFATTPDTPGEYNFTLSLTTNGETYTTTFTHTFE